MPAITVEQYELGKRLTLECRSDDRQYGRYAAAGRESEIGFLLAGVKCYMDDAKVRELFTDFCEGLDPDEAYLCGPFPMIETITNALTELGFDNDNIHKERYGPPRKGKQAAKPDASTAEQKDLSTIMIIMDGHRKSFEMPRAGDNIVDAAAEKGYELPFSCKGGVCATCRTHVRAGEVKMETNYGLEPWEVEKGFVLACQSHPVSKSVVLDYDKT